MQTRQHAAWRSTGQSTVAERTRVIADGGASVIAPQDTMLAFRLAVELGSSGIATEVRRTADGVFVLVRDGELSRTTDCAGTVEQLPWEQIATCDAGYWFSQGDSDRFPYRGLKVGVARLEDLRELVTCHPDLELHIGVDGLVAGCEQPKLVLKALSKRLDALGLAATTTLWTRQLDVLDLLHRAIADLRVAFALTWPCDLDTALVDGGCARHRVLHIDAGMLEALGPSVAHRVHDAGKEIYLWAAPGWASREDLQALGFDGVVTGNPEQMLQMK